MSVLDSNARTIEQPIVSMIPISDPGYTVHLWPFSWRFRQLSDLHPVGKTKEAWACLHKKLLVELFTSRAIHRCVRNLHEARRLVEPYSATTNAFLTPIDKTDFYPVFNKRNNVTKTSGFKARFILPHLEVKVQKGEVLFFASDIIHAGAKHKSHGQNRRLHTYNGFRDQALAVKSTVDVPLSARLFMEDSECAATSFFKTQKPPAGAYGAGT